MNLGLETPGPFVSFVPSFVPLVVQFWVPLRLGGETRRRRRAATLLPIAAFLFAGPGTGRML